MDGEEKTEAMDAIDRTSEGVIVPVSSPIPPQSTPPPLPQPSSSSSRLTRVKSRLRATHSRIPYLRALPLAAVLIILLLLFLNLLVWSICLTILASHPALLSTAALAYSLGLRHALDADHISAIDLMTRRLIATGQRPATVGTFFSLGHSTIVVITSIVVAATAAGVSKKFGGFSSIGGIIGSSVSAAFLIALGLMNAYILYRLVLQIQKIIRLPAAAAEGEEWKIEGGGVLFRILKRMFKLIDRPWKMYPLGVLFGMGFDTSSEIALLGISSIQGAKGTNIWLILIFPVLFTVGMCLLDTIDGALMMSLYVAPMGLSTSTSDKPSTVTTESEGQPEGHSEGQVEGQLSSKAKDPLLFLYYSSILTALTVLVALIIGTIQLLTLILNVAHPTGGFWTGVGVAGDHYDVIGAAICGSFVVVGAASVVCYRPWRAWVEKKRAIVVGDGGGALMIGPVDASTVDADPSRAAEEDGAAVDVDRRE